ncbi:MAG: hypothetical protein KGR69_06765 [Verrucomicrobia bacterium]|nr:hypothetical protein [Verrucomicrobiota bacterium]
MSFQPLQDSDPDRVRPSDLGLLVIRVLTVAAFTYYQLAKQLGLALGHLWDATDWNLVTQLTERGVPSPSAVAAVATGLSAANLLGLLFGFLTRINALLLTLMTGFILFSAVSLSPTLNPQALSLYLGVFAGFCCGGAGRLSLDFLFAGHRARRRAV